MSVSTNWNGTASPRPIVTVHPRQPEAAQETRDRIEQAVSSAFDEGHDAGERIGYIVGWRSGLYHGLGYGLTIGGALLALVFALPRWL